MRTLLAVLSEAETTASVLAAVSLVAQRLPGARIDVLHVRPAADPSFMPTEEVMTPDRQARFEAREASRSAALRAIYDDWRRGQAADWREEIGEPADLIARAAAPADLLVMGRGTAPGIENALFDAGAAILLAPPDAPKTLGAHMAVAWKPGGTTERAVVAAAPLLRAAERVTLLVGTDNDGDRTPPEALVQSLAGLERLPQVDFFELGGEPIGRLLLQQAHRLGADLLVMGAYAHRPGVEAVFGGATREILAAADLPVFLRH
jgi:nucleotide-binding universal stress UspA family protein